MDHRDLKLGKYSVGIGDRFAHQAKAQLQACVQALASGVESYSGMEQIEPRARHHRLPACLDAASRQCRRPGAQLEAAVVSANADHITLQTFGRFLDACDYYTIDVAEFIGQPAPEGEIESFGNRSAKLLGRIRLDGADDAFEIKPETVRQTARKYLTAVRKAGEVYRAIRAVKGEGKFIPEISMDETDSAQSPVELLLILAAIAD